MSNIAGLPPGIQVLRNFKLENGLPVPPARFERLVERLEECASSNGRVAKCLRCPYLEECTAKFDAICGKVAMY
ncbi:hypothetical protein [Dehalococcoides mccartyi]|nr:hypothetical protein [Dehalococcoides mccartyi]